MLPLQTVRLGGTGFIFSLNYIQFKPERVLIDISVTNNEPMNFFTCGLPRLEKTDYGDFGSATQQGGLYIGVVDKPKIQLFCYDLLSGPNQTQEGWVVFNFDPQRFNLNGLYTLYNIGANLPNITFSINQ
jgi:hypothetical protein